MINVLVVEDSLSQRQMISAFLTKIGLNVTEASNGSEAFYKICTQCPGLPDLIVLDIVMPLMNGYEVCRCLKSHPKTRKVPVVLCSAKAEPLDRYWGMKQGADAYISKPFYPQELLGTLKQVLQRRQAASVLRP
ncbi:MAG: response regulator [Geitlerinemataceae cyanobacterium]